MKIWKLSGQLRKAHTRPCESIKMCIGGSFDIIFLCTNMRIEAKRASYHIEIKRKDLETRRWSYEENTKVVRQLRKAHTRVRESIKMFISGSWCVNQICTPKKEHVWNKDNNITTRFVPSI